MWSASEYSLRLMNVGENTYFLVGGGERVKYPPCGAPARPGPLRDTRTYMLSWGPHSSGSGDIDHSGFLDRWFDRAVLKLCLEAFSVTE